MDPSAVLIKLDKIEYGDDRVMINKCRRAAWILNGVLGVGIAAKEEISEAEVILLLAVTAIASAKADSKSRQ